MRERISSGRLRLRLALASVLAATVVSGMTGAFAQNAKEDDDELIDVKIFRGVMKELGFQRDEAPIEYRERSPLVVPPSRSLPPPRNEAAVTTNPAWPNDPDVAKRRQEATVTPSQKARLSGDRVMDNLRPLSPDELERGRTVARPDGGSARTAEEAAAPMKPSELGSSKSLWNMMFSTFSNKEETTQFTGETPRTTLTTPPSGYQTPSSAQPYGLTPTKAKPPTAEDRMLPTR